MSNVLRLALVDPQDDSRETLKKMLLGMDIVWLEAECSRYEFFPDVVTQSTPDVGVVSLDGNPDSALALLEKMHATAPDCAILAVSSSGDGQLILRAMRAGAKEFLTLPLSLDDLMAALTRISDSKNKGKSGGNRNAKIIAVAGASGGVGCTSVAVNLGCVLASNPENSVALVDLDLAIGDADVFLDTIPDYSLLDVTQNVSRLDFQLLKRSLTKHSSGLYLLPRPVQLQDVAYITPESLRRVFGLLKATFSHIVIDVSKGFTEIDLAAFEFANDVLMVVQLDLPCLRNLVRLQMSFDEIEGLREKLKIIVNRVGLESGQIKLKKAKETIGREIFGQIPNDYRTMIEVRNNGIPLLEQAPKAPITVAMQNLANAINGSGAENAEDGDDAEAAGASASGSSSWLNFWPNKGKQKNNR
ncbi:AAA family ATPase [Aureliella helgolandensis]|uniref:Septum site-determining protein MinD n=1 Tax=Aureliella helgolandensis TaxID=2527968 RepID=A0A518G2K5_9BACT|nr:AAA family ATPase [Aureliella helgolandensis]QDV22833.1 Septum site-determining protein MinD [Aureliella helgolandensis]